MLHRYDGVRRSTGRRAPRPSTPSPGQQVRLRVVNTDNGAGPALGDRRAVPGPRRRRHRPQRARRRSRARSRAPGRRPGRPRLRRARRRRPRRLRRHHRMVFGADPTGGDRRGRPRSSLDLLSYGEPADLGFDPAEADRRFEYRIGRRPGFLDGRPGMWWTINGHLFPDVPMYMVERGRRRRLPHRERQRRRPPDAPARPPRRRALPRRRAGHRQPVVGRLARGGRRRDATRSPSWPTTRASGWTTATTCRTRPRAWSRT